MKTAVEVARQYGYSIEPWDVFVAEEALPEGLLARALSVKAELEASGEAVTHVLYDLDDDDQGFLILGTDTESMALELVGHLFPEFRDVDIPGATAKADDADSTT